jgi:hypothetical protein
MKKKIGIYGIVWAICLAVFNLITFMTPNEIGGVSKFSGAFWVGYIFITVAFVGQLVCACFALKEDDLKKLFYNVSLPQISYSGLIAMLIVGGIFMAIPTLPSWIAIIICAIILTFNAIAVIKATAAANIVSGIDEKIKAETFFMKNLAADAQSLMTSAATDELRAEAKKIYDAIRYSDPVANPSLSELDNQIERQFAAFSDAVKAEDFELAKETSGILAGLVEKRNYNCKL